MWLSRHHSRTHVKDAVVVFDESDCVSYKLYLRLLSFFFFFQAEDGIRDKLVTGVQTCALPISVWLPPRMCFWPRRRSTPGGYDWRRVSTSCRCITHCGSSRKSACWITSVRAADRKSVV